MIPQFDGLSSEEQMKCIVAQAICELVPDSRRRGRSVVVGVKHFEVHMWLAEAKFSVVQAATQFVIPNNADFDLADPESIPDAAATIVGWLER